MCGILGIVTSIGERVGMDRALVERLRDRMAHRGPDGAGLWDGGNVVLAHRRLAVIDPSPAGNQPMVFAGPGGVPRGVLVYNGELYNDHELRSALTGRGTVFTTHCDTQAFGEAVLAWGGEATHRLRGMYAAGMYDHADRRLVLMCDPLGIKPLFWCRFEAGGVPHVAFASEIAVLVELLGIVRGTTPLPDMVGVSAYLTTIRTTLGSRTMFAGVQTLEPGQVLGFHLDSRELVGESKSYWDQAAAMARPLSDAEACEEVGACVTDSVARHLRSDVPVCALLSGGLDSSIITAVAAERVQGLRSFCAGASQSEAAPDFAFARQMATLLGTVHREAPVSRAAFLERWPHLVSRLGVPLSTPNEVAIHEVSCALRADGCVVTLSGEGADELFGGYDAALEPFAGDGGREGGIAHLDLASWVSRQEKPSAFLDRAWRLCEGDEVLKSWYHDEFERVRAQRCDSDGLQAHLRWLRRVNLAGLLRRLDSATMLAGVEGRTPFADVAVMELAESLPMSAKFVRKQADPHCRRTKRVLREAFQGRLPRDVLERPKASFPLPFEAWIDGFGATLRGSMLVQALFREEWISGVARSTSAHWRQAWPVLNLALWGERWWGSGRASLQTV